jgi:hypothetical protein
LRSSQATDRDVHRQFTEDLHRFIRGLHRGDICMFSVVQWIQDNIDSYFVACHGLVGDKKVEREEDTVFTRLWIYSHHIYSKFKRKDIIDWAGELKLSGFSLPGKPGVICVEGYSRNVDEFWHRIRRLNWKRLAIREKEETEIGNDDINIYKKFSSFEEKVFDARAGKGREYHMDLGKLYTFLEERGCGAVFTLFFGVEGKTASTNS